MRFPTVEDDVASFPSCTGEYQNLSAKCENVVNPCLTSNFNSSSKYYVKNCSSSSCIDSCSEDDISIFSNKTREISTSNSLNNLNPDCQFSDSKHNCLKNNHNHKSLANRTRLTSQSSAAQTRNHTKIQTTNLTNTSNKLNSCGSSNTSDSDSLNLTKSSTCPENINKILLPTHILLQNIDSPNSGPASSSGVSSSKSGEAVNNVDDTGWFS